VRRAAEFHFGIVTAWPEEDWHSRRLTAACARRGHAACVDPSTLSMFLGEGAPKVCRPLSRSSGFDAWVLARGLGPRGDPDVQFEIYRALEGTGALVVNRIDALLAAQDKLRTSWLLRRAGVPTPVAAAAQTRQAALAALEVLGTAVLKPIAGSLGEGVVRVRADRRGRREVAEWVERQGAVYLQRYVAHPGRDARLFVVGDRVAGAMERLAPPGEWRTNVEFGARVRSLAPDRPTAVVACRAARALGLDWAGVDLVAGPDGPTVLEVNGNPSWAGILDATGEDMAEPIAEHVLARALRRAGGVAVNPEQSRANHG